MTHFIDFIKRDKIQTECFIIGLNQCKYYLDKLIEALVWFKTYSFSLTTRKISIVFVSLCPWPICVMLNYLTSVFISNFGTIFDQSVFKWLGIWCPCDNASNVYGKFWEQDELYSNFDKLYNQNPLAGRLTKNVFLKWVWSDKWLAYLCPINKKLGIYVTCLLVSYKNFKPLAACTMRYEYFMMNWTSTPQDLLPQTVLGQRVPISSVNYLNGSLCLIDKSMKFRSLYVARKLI